MTNATIRPELSEALQNVLQSHTIKDICKRAKVKADTIEKIQREEYVSDRTQGKILAAVRSLQSAQDRPSRPASDFAQFRTQPNRIPVQPSHEPLEEEVPEEPIEEPLQEEPQPPIEEEETTVVTPQAPVRVLPPRAPNPRGVDTTLTMRGPSDDVQEAAAQLGVGEQRREGSVLPTVRIASPISSPHALLEKVLADRGSSVRVDRTQPRSIGKIWEPPTPTTLGHITKITEDNHGGGQYKIRVYTADGQTVEHPFALPGEPILPAGGDEKGKPSGTDAVAALQEEVQKARLRREMMEVQAETAEFEARAKGKVAPTAPVGPTPADIAKIVQDAVAAATAPLLAERRDRDLKQEIAGPLVQQIESLKAMLQQQQPKPVDPAVEALKTQNVQLTRSVEELREAILRGPRNADQSTSPLSMIKQVLELVSTQGKGKSQIFEDLLLDVAMDKLRGREADPAPRSDDGDDYVKIAIKEFVPVIRDFMKNQQQNNAQLTPQQAAAMKIQQDEMVRIRVAEASQRVMDELARRQQIAQGQQPPQPGQPRSAAPLPNVPPGAPLPSQGTQTPPAPPQLPKAPAAPTDRVPEPPEERSPEAINDALETLIDEVGKGMPRDSEWVGIAIYEFPVETLNKIMEIDDAQQLRDVLAPHADAKLLEQVKIACESNRRIKDYVIRGIMAVKDEWGRIVAGEPEEPADPMAPPLV